jgi:DNA-binding CsgD family transcriptional regulator
VESLTSSDMAAVLDYVEQLFALHDGDFAETVLGGITVLVRCDSAAYNEIDHRTRSVTAVVHPLAAIGATRPAAMEPYIGQHPVIAEHTRTGVGQPLKISDFLSAREFHSLDLYRQVFGPMGIEDQMALSVADPGAMTIGLALNRSRRDFAERDRSVLALTRPHLVNAFRHLEARQRAAMLLRAFDQGIEQTGRGLVVLDRAGGVEDRTSRAQALLDAYFDDADGLPAEVADWVALGDRELVVHRDERRLRIRHLHPAREGDPTLLLLAEDGVEPRAAIHGLGLAPREAEVLEHVVLGRADKAIAATLGISPRTVGKHLERVYAKLGVNSRAAAIALVIQRRADDPAT